MLITFEGIEGSGKTTQSIILAERVASNYDLPFCFRTAEPGGTTLGRSIRRVLLDPNSNPTPLAELLLYAADRAQHVETIIKPHLKAGDLVLCDRFYDSTIAYQSYGRGIDLEIIHNLNRISCQGIVPDLTFWLDIEPEQGLKRVAKRGEIDRIEAESIEFHHWIREGYRWIYEQCPNRVVRIDASRSKDVIADEIFEIVTNKLKVKDR